MSCLLGKVGKKWVGEHLALVPQLPACNGGSCVLHGEFKSLLFHRCVDKLFFFLYVRMIAVVLVGFFRWNSLVRSFSPFCAQFAVMDQVYFSGGD